MSKGQKTIAPDQVNVMPPQVNGFVSFSTTLDMDIVVFPYDSSKASERTGKLLVEAKAGTPLQRSKTTDDLAAKAVSLQGRRPESAHAWASNLARSLTSPKD